MHPSAIAHDLHLYTYLRQKLLEAFPDADEENDSRHVGRHYHPA